LRHNNLRRIQQYLYPQQALQHQSVDETLLKLMDYFNSENIQILVERQCVFCLTGLGIERGRMFSLDIDLAVEGSRTLQEILNDYFSEVHEGRLKCSNTECVANKEKIDGNMQTRTSLVDAPKTLIVNMKRNIFLSRSQESIVLNGDSIVLNGLFYDIEFVVFHGDGDCGDTDHPASTLTLDHGHYFGCKPGPWPENSNKFFNDDSTSHRSNSEMSDRAKKIKMVVLQQVGESEPEGGGGGPKSGGGVPEEGRTLDGGGEPEEDGPEDGGGEGGPELVREEAGTNGERGSEGGHSGNGGDGQKDGGEDAGGKVAVHAAVPEQAGFPVSTSGKSGVDGEKNYIGKSVREQIDTWAKMKHPETENYRAAVLKLDHIFFKSIVRVMRN
jgi:hypothetical protein